MTRQLLTVVVVATLVAAVETPRATQIPLSPVRDAGQTVTPAYEGWYPNPDGTYMLSFGYFNRNREEVLDIPVGPNNFVSPGVENQGQPTRFHPQRHWGVFTVRVPADFGEKRLTWTLVVRGETFAIPGHLHRDWLLDAKHDPASDNTPPVVRFDPAGPDGAGPDGVTTGPLTVAVGDGLPLTLWATDDEIRPRRRRAGDDGPPILIRWFLHQGPGAVEFAEAEPVLDTAGKATTQATFSQPGEYVLRARVNDLSGISNAGHSQCCWTNGYVRVTVVE